MMHGVAITVRTTKGNIVVTLPKCRKITEIHDAHTNQNNYYDPEDRMGARWCGTGVSNE